MSHVGKIVSFPEYDEQGEPIAVFGTVELEFREPKEEDPMQRLSLRVRTNDNRVFTAYAHDCKPVG